MGKRKGEINGKKKIKEERWKAIYDRRGGNGGGGEGEGVELRSNFGGSEIFLDRRHCPEQLLGATCCPSSSGHG